MIENMRNELPKRDPRSHKGTYGKVLCIAGSVNMAGAAYLCAHAAYRTGAGLVRILTPEENRVILQTLIPEAVLTTFSTQNPDLQVLRDALAWASVVAIGPGLGKESWAALYVDTVMKEYHGPLVVDADGINHLADHDEWLLRHEGPVILTPHVGEFLRLMGPVLHEREEIPKQAVCCAKKYHSICVLKDAPSAVASPDGTCYVNTTGNHGMSTGGSGDVLTGIIAGLLAQKCEPYTAAKLGTWLHGSAGDLAAEKEGYYGLMARHLIEYLPEAMKIKEND